MLLEFKLQLVRKHRHAELYPHAYHSRCGVLRPIIPEVVHNFLDCGDLARSCAWIRCDHFRTLV